MDAALIAFILLGIAVGGLIGWLFGSRQDAGARQTIETLRLQLDEVVKERDSNRTAAQELLALKAAQEEREKAFEQQIVSLEKAKETLVVQFREIGDKLLEKAQADFLAKADERLTKADREQSAKLQQLGSKV